MNIKVFLIRVFVAAPLLALITSSALSFTNVKDFGAIGDGSTDDTNAINLAITSADGTGKPVPPITSDRSIYFPPGRYKYVGRLVLPSYKSWRLYGDGIGVSTIAFFGVPGGGIYHNAGSSTLTVEGLTLQANTANCDLAINAICNPGGNMKFRTVTIRNVEIMGSDRTNTPAGYWDTGISLYQARNALIEDVQVHGRYDFAATGPTSSVGIRWAGSPPSASSPTTQVFLHNIYVEYFQVGIETYGWVEGFYMSGFELVFCGYPLPNVHSAMELTGANPTGAVPVFQISNGHINQISSGIKMTNIAAIKISNVEFFNQKYIGTHLSLINCSGVTLTENSFSDLGVSGETESNGIYCFSTTPGASSSIRMCGNIFDHMSQSANGSCIVVEANCRNVKILDTLFGTNGPLRKYYPTPPSPDTYIRDIP